MRSVKKILAIRIREIGDTILLTPMLRQLKRIYPDATLDVVCEDRNASVLVHNPNINRLYCLPRKASLSRFLQIGHTLRRERYDLVVDSQSMPKTAFLTRLTGARARLGFKNRWLRSRLCYTAPYLRDPLQYTAVSNLELLQDRRVDLTDHRLEVFSDPEDHRAAQKIIQLTQCRSLVAINPVTRFSERQWTFDGFAAIGDRLSSIGFQIILLYGPGEREKAEQVARRMQHPSLIDYPMPNILELRCILSHCKLYVGNDGGPKHLAIAAGVPTVTLFGNSPDPWTPWADPLHRVIASAKSGHSIRSSGELIADASSIDAISIESVWRQIEISISKIRQAG